MAKDAAPLPARPGRAVRVEIKRGTPCGLPAIEHPVWGRKHRMRWVSANDAKTQRVCDWFWRPEGWQYGCVVLRDGKWRFKKLEVSRWLATHPWFRARRLRHQRRYVGLAEPLGQEEEN